MNTVMQRLRADLGQSIQTTLEISRKIQGLKWKEGSQSEIQRLRLIVDDRGRRVNGKRSLKEYSCPETGPERNRLWVKKRSIGCTTREYLLLWAMLRGKAYKTVETKCREENYPNNYGMARLLEGYFEKGKCPIGIDEINNWVKGTSMPNLAKEAA